jgi:IclR family transcriptional regulator, KDG regulon repressor
MQTFDSDYIVQPVVKALQVLQYVASQGHMVSLTEVVHELDLPKTTVFRYLQTLSATGYLEHDVARDRYGVGGTFRGLARIDNELNGLREIARSEMLGLVETFNETVNLGILSDRQIVYIDMIDPGRSARAQARIGHRHPIHSTSLGKAILAFLPDGETLLKDSGLPQMTFKTLTDRAKIRRQTVDIRQRGYAVEFGENEDGLMCVGVPILDRGGYPVAAMSLSAPERRMPPALASAAADALKSAAGRISLQLAGRA